MSIYLNHERIPRDDIKSKIMNSLSALSLPSTIDWKEVLEIPTKSEEGAVASVVSLYHKSRSRFALTFFVSFGSLLVSLLDFSLSLVQ